MGENKYQALWALSRYGGLEKQNGFRHQTIHNN